MDHLALLEILVMIEAQDILVMIEEKNLQL